MYRMGFNRARCGEPVAHLALFLDARAEASGGGGGGPASSSSSSATVLRCLQGAALFRRGDSGSRCFLFAAELVLRLRPLHRSLRVFAHGEKTGREEEQGACERADEEPPPRCFCRVGFFLGEEA
jgi:hypothetical protein